MVRCESFPRSNLCPLDTLPTQVHGPNQTKYTATYPTPFKRCRYAVKKQQETTCTTTTDPPTSRTTIQSWVSNSFPLFRPGVSLGITKDEEAGKRKTLATAKEALCT